MKRETFTIAAVAFLCIAAASSPPVTFESLCECRDNHGKHRWSVKNDPTLPPADANAIQAVTPSDIYNWPGPDVRLTQQSERTGIENKWFALTGRVVALKVETDGDIRIALQDATGDKPGIVVVEVPEKPQWCEIRNMVFSWTRTRDHHWSHGLATSVAVWLKSEHLKLAAKFKTKLPKHCWLR